MDNNELFYPQICAELGGYVFEEGIEIQVSSAKGSRSDWAKVRFTKEFENEIQLVQGADAMIQMGYGGVLDEVFQGYVAQGITGGEIVLKDEMLILEATKICETFQDATPQDIIRFILARCGITQMRLSEEAYPQRRLVPIPLQSAAAAIEAVNAAWGIQNPFFFRSGVFHWGTVPEQEKIYTFEYGVNILSLNRVGRSWELETVSAPFVRHSQVIQVEHPLYQGEAEVRKVLFTTNDAGFIRTFIYF